MTTTVLFRRLAPTSRIDLARELPAADPAASALVLLHGRGRSVGLRAPAGLRSLWFCLRGSMVVESEDGPFRLDGRTWLSLRGECEVHARCEGHSEWIAILATPALHARLTSGGQVPGASGRAMASCRLPMAREIVSALGALLRRPEGCPGGERWLVDLFRITRCQQERLLEPWLRRAQGRTQAHRRQVLNRLLRARNRILNAPGEPQAASELSKLSRYSKSHFIRLFRGVFGMTPHELLTERRIDLAKRLIAEGELTIGEVAWYVGFESRHAFARLFKRHVGVSASAYRLGLVGGAPERAVHRPNPSALLRLADRRYQLGPP